MVLPNHSKRGSGILVRVMCPVCGAGGAHPLHMKQPLCHLCNYKVKMMPANNTRITCTWKYAKHKLLEEL